MLGDREGAGRSSAGRTEGKENGTGHTLLTGTGDKPWVLVKNESGTRYLEHVTARLYKAQPPVTLPGQPRCTRPCLGAAISGRPRPAATSGPGPAPAGRSPPPLRPALRQPVAAVRRGPGPSDEPRPSAISARPSAALRGLGPGGSGGGHGRYALKAMKQMEPQVKQALQNLPKPDFRGYYRGGFEPKMTKREAALILGVSPTANRSKIREAHRRIMLLNHPDKEAVSDSVIPSIRTASSSVRRLRDLLRRLLLW
uniref:Mitochondrial import inner membrane translocase subunit TIM14 n=1 Tax=Cairina moschata TaxID=8855 RepID=A0A8C3GFH5_CAIMO